MSKVKQGYIYPAKKGGEWSSKQKKYNHYLCCMTGDFFIVDCVPCTKNGDYFPGIECGIPIDTSRFYVTRGVMMEY